MRWWKLGLLMGLLVSCRPVSFRNDPFSPMRDGTVSHFWTVDWWTSLVTPPMLEYLPREPASPAFDSKNRQIVSATRDGFVRAVSTTDGHVRWSYQTQGPFNSGPVVVDDSIFVACADGFLYALKAQTGELRWKYNAQEELMTLPVYSDGKLLVAGITDSLYAVDASTGAWVWQYRRDAPTGFTIRGVSRPTAVDGMVFAGFSDGTLVSLQLKDGTVNWEKVLTTGTVKFRDVDAAVVSDGKGTIFTATYASGAIALRAETGDVLWSNNQPGITHLHFNDGVLLASGENLVAAFAPQNGRALWSQSLSGEAAGSILATRQWLAVPTGRAMVLLDSKTGTRLTHWNPGKGVTATPIMQGTHLYVLSNLGTLFDLNTPGASE